MSEYIGIVIFFALTGAVVSVFILLSSILGPSKPSKIKSKRLGSRPVTVST